MGTTSFETLPYIVAEYSTDVSETGLKGLPIKKGVGHEDGDGIHLTSLLKDVFIPNIIKFTT